MKSVLMLLSLALLAACAPQPERIKATASGLPEGFFANTTPDQIRTKIAAACRTRGFSVLALRRNEAVCGKEMSGTEAVLVQAAMRGAPAAAPQTRIGFTIVPTLSGIHVTAREWTELQLADGERYQQEIGGTQRFNELQLLVNSLAPNRVVAPEQRADASP